MEGNVRSAKNVLCVDHPTAVSAEAHDYIHGPNCSLLISICRLVEMNYLLWSNAARPVWKGIANMFALQAWLMDLQWEFLQSYWGLFTFIYTIMLCSSPGYDWKEIMHLKWCDILLQGLAAASLWDLFIYRSYCLAKQLFVSKCPF